MGLDTLHMSRPASASWAHEAGIDMETISKLVGRSSTALARSVYRHIFEATEREAATELEALFQERGS